MLDQKQQEFLEAMMEENTVEKAVKRVGIGKATAYRYMEEPEFKKQLSEHRQSVMNALAQKLQKHGESAVDVLGKNLTDPESTVSTRNQTAKILLDFVYKNHEIENVIDRLDEVERLLENEGR